ncbi:MAG TPA: MBL fold metallo-hydrolase [Candidatus Ozemobacteraceae bacterium]|nr:MBL fold metallo-hydrolase [Candidatus Ozemobacteraceae bacterium]
MIRLLSLGSGSRGNASLIEIGRSFYLIDAGLSFRRISQSLAQCGFDLDRLAGIIVTHEHDDHVKGLQTALKKTDVPVYATPGTIDALIDDNLDNRRFVPVRSGEELDLGKIRVWPFPVPHDAAEPIGLRLEACGRTIGIASDMGHVTPVILEHLTDCDLLCLESNYDDDLLSVCRYPDWLKRRIRGPRGHLGNRGVRGILSRLKRQLQHLMLFHISQESNTPELVRENVEEILRLPLLQETRLIVASQDEPTPILDLLAEQGYARSAVWRQQRFTDLYAHGNLHDW